MLDQIDARLLAEMGAGLVQLEQAKLDLARIAWTVP